MTNDLGPLHFFERLLIEDDDLIKEIVEESLMFFDYSYTLDWHKGTYSFYDPEIQKPNTLYIASLIESKFKNETDNSIAFIKNEFFSDSSSQKEIKLRYYFTRIDKLLDGLSLKIHDYPFIYKQLISIADEINLLLISLEEKELILKNSCIHEDFLIDSDEQFTAEIDKFFNFLLLNNTISPKEFRLLISYLSDLYESGHINDTPNKKISFNNIIQRELSYCFYVFNKTNSKKSFKHKDIASFLINYIENFKEYNLESLTKTIGSTDRISWKGFIPEEIKNFKKNLYKKS